MVIVTGHKETQMRYRNGRVLLDVACRRCNQEWKVSLADQRDMAAEANALHGLTRQYVLHRCLNGQERRP